MTHTPPYLPSPDIATHLLNIVERLTIIEQMNATVIAEQDEAKVSRRGIHEKLTAINKEVSGVKTDVKVLQEQVSDMKPKVALLDRLRLQLTGGGIVIGFLWSIALIAIGMVLKSLWVWAFAR